MELGLSRHDALENMKLRTDIDDLVTFAVVLSQADALGLPIGRVLQAQADEMRDKRRQRARERAAKVPVKILFPLAVCFLPAILYGPWTDFVSNPTRDSSSMWAQRVRRDCSSSTRS